MLFDLPRDLKIGRGHATYGSRAGDAFQERR